MQVTEFLSAIKMLSDEKGLSEEVILEAVESALAAAYRKDYGKPGQVIKVQINAKANEMKVTRVFSIIENDEELINPEAQLTIDQAKKMKKNAKAGDEIELPLEEKADFGRVAAQTAKQVIIQRLREAERDILYSEFKEKEKEIVNATVQRLEGPNVILDMGKMNGIMLPQDQIPGERYYNGQRLKVYVGEVEETNRGPRILVSRSRPEFIIGLFAQEVPEIESGAIEIVGIAREAGSRTKIAVATKDDNLDPVGSVVGQRGTRVQSVLTEIPNEKIDIILFDDNMETYITNALSPAKIDKIKFNKKQNNAQIWVPDDQLSLAIGKSGQNVRLASKLSGWTLDIVKDEKTQETKPKSDTKTAEDGSPVKKEKTSKKNKPKKETEKAAESEK